MNQLDCVISYFFQLHLMLHACVERFDVMGTVGKILKTKRGLKISNKRSTQPLCHQASYGPTRTYRPTRWKGRTTTSQPRGGREKILDRQPPEHPN